jgi:hypothetical protein
VKITDNGDAAQSALRRIDAALSRAGMPRGERRLLIKEMIADKLRAVGDSGTPGAADGASDFTEALQAVRDAIRVMDQSAT